VEVQAGYVHEAVDEEIDESVKKFYNLVQDADKPLHDKTQYNKLSAIVHLYNLKCMGGLSNKPIAIHIGLVILMIAGLPLVLEFSLALVLFHGVLRSSLLWFDPVRKPNTSLWLWLLPNFIGFACYLRIFISPSPFLQ